MCPLFTRYQEDINRWGAMAPDLLFDEENSAVPTQKKSALLRK